MMLVNKTRLPTDMLWRLTERACREVGLGDGMTAQIEFREEHNSSNGYGGWWDYTRDVAVIKVNRYWAMRGPYHGHDVIPLRGCSLRTIFANVCHELTHQRQFQEKHPAMVESLKNERPRSTPELEADPVRFGNRGTIIYDSNPGLFNEWRGIEEGEEFQEEMAVDTSYTTPPKEGLKQFIHDEWELTIGKFGDLYKALVGGIKW